MGRARLGEHPSARELLGRTTIMTTRFHAVYLAAFFGLSALPALAQDINYELINNSSYVLDQFYTSAASDPNWGPDLMSGLDLYSGESGTVTIADGGSECVYDILVVTMTGEELSDQVNICELASYTVND
jgi:hypothetical protein